mmetsp:Transcript_40697/g.86688  ORF Transcript_40697/g.86688 Transcript_40697/m.86688 type:complete len:836 (+) Transcript_40697:67-2574(+)
MTTMTANSERGWSLASSTVVDTRSEPARCLGLEAEKIMQRALIRSLKNTPLSPVTLLTPRAKLRSGDDEGSLRHVVKGCIKSAGDSKRLSAESWASSMASNFSALDSSVADSGVSKSNVAKSSVAKSGAVSSNAADSSLADSGMAPSADAGNGCRSKHGSKKPNKTSSGSMSSLVVSKNKNNHKPILPYSLPATQSKNYSSATRKTRKRSPASSSRKYGRPSSASTRSNSSDRGSHIQTTSYIRHNSRDPGKITHGTNSSRTRKYHQNHSHGSSKSSSSLAIVPGVPPQRPPPSRHRLLDPPSGESTYGSRSGTDLQDPPSNSGIQSIRYANFANANSNASSSQESFAYANIYAPKHEVLTVWKERKEEDESTEALHSVEESRTMETTLPSHGTVGSGGTATTRSSRSSESSYFSANGKDSSTLSQGVNNVTDEAGSELASVAEQALAIQEEQSEGTTSNCGDDKCQDDEDDTTDCKDARALVQSDYHGGVDSLYDGEDSLRGGAIVEAKSAAAGRYLSKAVDNHQAIVPIDSSVYEAYDHTFVTCPEHLRFRFLYTFLKKNLDKKVMIFFSTSNSAKFHAKLLGHFHVPVLTMHGKQNRERFVSRFFKFSDWDTGILCATDAAGRDLDVPPSVDWVVQFEPPDDPSEYILRVARISCDSDRVGRSLLFLNPGEQGFLKYYRSSSIPVSEFEIPKGKLADVQSHIESHVNENERLLRLSRDAYGSYMMAYASHGFRDVYNVHDLNKSDVASAFGLVGLPSSEDNDTLDTETLAVSSFGDGGERMPARSGGGGRSKTWQKQEKVKTKSWMRGEKSWPHSQIKLHPKFKHHEAGTGY